MKNVFVVFTIVVFVSVSEAKADAGKILEDSGVSGGLTVLVGAHDPAFAIKLGTNDRYLVHVLDRDPAAVKKARDCITSGGLYGRISVDQLNGDRLPYANNIVNLLVMRDAGCKIGDSEIKRVLAPRGVAVSGTDGKIVYRKPVPGNIDDWTHFLYDAAASTASKDTVAHFPEHMLWQAGPAHARHHDAVQGIEAIVSSNGRLFYILDEAPPSVGGALPDQWRLIARDAYSGVLLWKKSMGKFGWAAWAAAGNKSDVGRTQNPKQMHRRLVAVGDKVYVTLAYDAPVSRIDGATGEILNTYKGTEHTGELIYFENRLILKTNKGDGSIVAIRPDDGALLWKSDGAVSAGNLSDMSDVFLCAGGGGVYFLASDGVKALDIKTGRLLWSEGYGDAKGTKKRNGKASSKKKNTKIAGGYISLMYNNCKVIVLRPSGSSANIKTYSATTGKMLWSKSPGALTYGTRSALFAAQGLIWSYGTKGTIVGLDPDTGNTSRTIDCTKARNTCGGHLRCYVDKATENTFWTTIGGKPQQVIDLKTGENCSMPWLRAGCRIGIIPANGLLYMTPNPCACHSEVQLNGLMALGPAGGTYPIDAEQQLQKGPAFKKQINESSGSAGQWPMHRHSASRLCSTRTEVPAELTVRWKQALGGVLSQPVVAGDMVYVSSPDTHTVHALNKDTGKVAWRFAAGGRIDSSPTFHKGRLLFGSADGWVYCLTASEGELIWRFRVAPSDHRIVSYGQLESLWPAHGSVLIMKDRAIVSAGRSSWLDGGMHLYALDPATGKQLAAATDSQMGNRFPGNPTPGMQSDLMVHDGEYAYMRCSRIKIDGNAIKVTPDPSPEKHGASSPNSDYPHVLTASDGMLNSDWFHRGGFMLRGKRGQAMAADASTVYTVPVFSSWGHSHAYVPGAGKVALTAKGGRNWSTTAPVRVNSMVVAGNHLFVAGPPDTVDSNDPWAAYEGRKGAGLAVYTADKGTQMAILDLPAVPVYDGMSAADKRLFISFDDGTIQCFGGK